MSLDELIVTSVLDDTNMPDRNISRGDYIRHFKGNIYKILETAVHTETEENLIIYESITEPRRVWARPLCMLMSEVDRDKYPDIPQKYRFEKVLISKKNPSKDSMVVSMQFSRQSESTCSTAISDFFKKYNPKVNAIKAWSNQNESYMYQMIPSYAATVTGEFSGIGLRTTPNVSDGIVLRFGFDNAKVTIFYGDEIYFIGDNRLVIKNKKDSIYELFEIIIA